MAAQSFFSNIYWCPGDYGNMRFAWGFPTKHAVPVRFHAVPILPQSVRFLVSSGPNAQKPCGSCAVPRGSYIAAVRDSLFRRGQVLRNHAVPVRFHAVPILPQSVRFLVSSRPAAQKPCGSCAVPRGPIGGVTQETAIPCSETMWFLCGSTWFHWRCNTRKCYSVFRNHESCADADKKTCLCL